MTLASMPTCIDLSEEDNLSIYAEDNIVTDPIMFYIRRFMSVFLNETLLCVLEYSSDPHLVALVLNRKASG